MESIVTSHIAKVFMANPSIQEYLDSHDNAVNVRSTNYRHDLYQRGNREVWLWIRKCQRGGLLTGGLVIEIEGEYQDHLQESPKHQIHLRPGWNKAKVQKSISLAIGELDKNRFLRQSRENLFHIVEQLPTSFWQQLTIDYDEADSNFATMDSATITFWHEVIGRHQAKVVCPCCGRMSR